ncbi:porin [Comamonas testosteroni]|uniref:porin n=1 Tax=Comamonas testosteroni TaxID=285 RepID=UPI002DB7D034|nr:porin [Comamonas testosteroni]MEB5967393.1 porin [Comamonas testosteroni]
MRIKLTGAAFLVASFAGAATAQVTLSGNIDAGIANVNDTWQVRGGGPGRNNVTFAGNEDLGGGSRAFFVLNHRFNPDDGTPSYGANNAASQPFFRQLWVGFENKSFGDIRLGRMLVPHQQFNGSYEPWQTYTVATMNTGGNPRNIRANDTIYYRSPSIAGARLHLSTSDPDSQGNSLSVGKRQLGAGIRYDAGPTSFAVAWDRDAADLKTKAAYGSYDFGFAKAMFQYERIDLNKTTGFQSKRWSVGGIVPLGVNVVKMGYKKVTDDIVGGSKVQTKYAIGIEHYLSKRTFLYSDLAKNSGDGYTNEQKKLQFDLGISHAF